MQERITAILADLVGIPSVNPDMDGGAGEAALARHIAGRLTALGLDSRLQPVGADRFNVTATVPGREPGPALLLNGHMDTVGVEGMPDPFSLRREGDRLYGRGAYDMKGSLAVMIALAEQWRDVPPRHDVVLSFVCDEETDSRGMQALVGDGLDRPASDFAGAIVLEPTEERIAIAHKGFVWFETVVTGAAAHGSRPEQGVEAIMPLAAALQALSRQQERLASATPHPLVGRGTLHPGTVSGGSALSVIADRARLDWERRTLPGETRESMEAELTEVLAAVRAWPGRHEVTGRILLERSPFETAADASLVRALQDCVHEPEVVGVSFWADSAFAHAAGIPTVLYGPVGHGAHAVDEWISLASMVRVAEVLADVAE